MLNSVSVSVILQLEHPLLCWVTWVRNHTPSTVSGFGETVSYFMEKVISGFACDDLKLLILNEHECDLQSFLKQLVSPTNVAAS